MLIYELSFGHDDEPAVRETLARCGVDGHRVVLADKRESACSC